MSFCQLCHSNLMNTNVCVSLRTQANVFDTVCRRCVVSSNNRKELYALEDARRAFNAARVAYHEAAYESNNWVPYYEELQCVNLYGTLPNYIFKD